jgi:hypothetical protein
MAELSAKTLERLEQLSRSIRVSPEIDEEVHREVMAHLRDKLMGYLIGSEKISEEDALLLVERHFGDTAVVQEMLREVHTKANHVGRRLMVVALVALLADFPGAILEGWALSSHPMGPVFGAVVFYFVGPLVNLGTAVAMWWMLFHWYLESLRGRGMWFVRRRNGTLLFMVLTTLTVYVATTVPLFWEGYATSENGTELVKNLNLIWYVTGGLVAAISSLVYAAQGFLWIWWTDRFNGNRLAVLSASAGWGVFFLVTCTSQWMFRFGVETSGMMIVGGSVIAITVVVATLYAVAYEVGVWVFRRVREARLAISMS